MSLLNHFTPTELLAAAEAADVWPKNRASCFGLNHDGEYFRDYETALAEADFL